MVETTHATSEDMVVEAVCRAASTERTIEIVGAGTKVGLGRPVAAGRRLDMTGLAGITLYEPAELVLSARAGTPLSEIETALATNGQALAFEPPNLSAILGGRDSQTIGGVVATNLSGPRRCVAGAARDHVLGLRAVNGMGELFKAGGRVVKNVTGYDLCKVLTGSYGTLAALTEVTLKVLPAPETEETIIAHGLDAEAAVRLMANGIGSATGVSGACWLPAELARRTSIVEAAAGSSATCLRLEGFGPSVAARRQAFLDRLAGKVEAIVLPKDASRKLWAEVRDVMPLCGRTGRAVWKLSLRPTDAPSVCALLASIADGETFLDWGGAAVWLSLPCGNDARATAVRGAVPVGGHATLIAAPEQVRATQAVFHPAAPAVAALEARVKESFDPGHVLNPGRMIAGI